MNHPITPLASSQINHDTITIELLEPSAMPPMVRIVWPLQASLIDPKGFPDAAAAVAAVVCTGAHCARLLEGARPMSQPIQQKTERINPMTELPADREYLPSLPAAVPTGRVLVHNFVRPVARQNGARGSRYWVQPPSDNLEVCDCGWAPELGDHYRVKGM